MQFGRSPPRTAWSDDPRPSRTVIGNPLRAWKMPATIQPPSTALVPLDPRLSRPYGSA